MMWGYGANMGWMWLWGVLMLTGIAVLVLLLVRMFGGVGTGKYAPPGQQGYAPPGQQGYAPPGQQGYAPQGPAAPPPGRSRARQILDERFAKGELTADEYREQLRVLGEGP